MEYTRSAYLKRLVSSMGSDQVKIITGVRRCGKSYLLNILFKKHLLDADVPEDHIVQVDFDGFRNRRYRDPETFLALVDERISAEGGRHSRTYGT